MLKYGFQAHLQPGRLLSDIDVHPAAYIHLWQRDEARCNAAFEKLVKSTDLKPISDPHLIFPLLPTYRKKHIWRFNKFGTDYLPRLASDISTSGGNRIFSPWQLRYLALVHTLHAVCRIISRGDYLATRDITGFFNRLPAGELLKRLQCFQDPRTYRKTSSENKAAIERGDVSFLQQQSCMFGHKQPTPSLGELCVIGAGTYSPQRGHKSRRSPNRQSDDFLFHSPAADGPEIMKEQQLRKIDEIMTKLGVPPNDKGQGPNTSIVFSGIRIDTTVKGIFSVDEEQ